MGGTPTIDVDAISSQILEKVQSQIDKAKKDLAEDAISFVKDNVKESEKRLLHLEKQGESFKEDVSNLKGSVKNTISQIENTNKGLELANNQLMELTGKKLPKVDEKPKRFALTLLESVGE